MVNSITISFLINFLLECSCFMDIFQATEFLRKQIKNPSVGLPDDIFSFVSQVTPLINVDLLIKDEQKRVLLSWRDGIYDGAGWNVPGGIVRFKETLEARILKVAETEVGAKLEFNPHPIAINQLFAQQNTRGHFISLLYKCFLSKNYELPNKGLSSNDVGFLKWHNKCSTALVDCNRYPHFPDLE